MRLIAACFTFICIASTPVLADEPPPGTSETATQPQAPAEPKLIPFEYTFHGFIKGGYTFIPYNAANSQLIGHDSGFRIYDTRLEFSGAFSKWVDFDLSIDSLSAIDPTTGLAPIQVGFEDAYTTLHWGGAWLRLGQFKTPFNGEFLLDDQNIPFARRSAISEGLAVDESNTPQPGILLDRQLGAMIGGRIVFVGETGLDLALAAVNGNGSNQARNDNPELALVGRAALGTTKNMIAIAGYWNDRTQGTLSTRQDERDLAGDVDFLVTSGSFHAGSADGRVKVFGMAVYRRTTFLTVPDNAPVNSLGSVVSVAMPFQLPSITLEPAVRTVYFQPDSTLTAPASATSTASSPLMIEDTTFGLNISPRVVPLRFQVNFTYRYSPAIWLQPSTITEAVLQANF